MSEVLVPVSVGELVDKVTILRIKSEKIKEAEKNKNIRAELTALLVVCEKCGIDAEDSLAGELQKINQKLWDIEDAIRDKERAKEFDKEFVELARAVYVSNDTRFDVKDRINKKSGSTYREEKSYSDYQ